MALLGKIFGGGKAADEASQGTSNGQPQDKSSDVDTATASTQVEQQRSFLERVFGSSSASEYQVKKTPEAEIQDKLEAIADKVDNVHSQLELKASGDTRYTDVSNTLEYALAQDDHFKRQSALISLMGACDKALASGGMVDKGLIGQTKEVAQEMLKLDEKQSEVARQTARQKGTDRRAGRTRDQRNADERRQARKAQEKTQRREHNRREAQEEANLKEQRAKDKQADIDQAQMRRSDGKVVSLGADLDEEELEEGATSEQRTKDSALTASNSTSEDAESRSPDMESREGRNQADDPTTSVVEASTLELPPLDADLASMMEQGRFVLDGQTAQELSQHAKLLELVDFNRGQELRMGQPRTAFCEEKTALVVTMLLARQAMEEQVARQFGARSGIKIPSGSREFSPTEAGIVSQVGQYVFN